MLSWIIRGVVAAGVRLFYRLERGGPPVPSGPVILAANHPNSLLDPILLFATSGRAPRPLAKAPLFRRAVVGRLIRWVGGIPVYRREDDAGELDRNQDMFRDASRALADGAAIQIFPEGRSHSDPALSSLRTGAARIALGAEAAAGWTLDVRLVPVGLTYERKAFFRGRAVALYGDPIEAHGYRATHERDPREAARQLTDELDRRLRALTLNLTESEDLDLLDVAERMWAVEHDLATPRQRLPLGDRLPRLQRFARGVAWLRARDPDRHRRLREAVARYARTARRLGAGEGEVPERYSVVPTIRWMVWSLLPALLLAPFLALAAVVWLPPYRLVGAYVERLSLPEDQVATYKLGASLVAYPLTLVLWVGIAGWAGGGWTALATAVALPIIGALGIRGLDRWRAVAEDSRVFRRVRRYAGEREGLRAERRELVAEFEALQRRMEAEDAEA